MSRFQETNEIQVGTQLFPAERWRDAVIHYVSSVWANEREVMIRPKICFDLFSFRLNEGTARYWALTFDPNVVDPPFFSEAEALIVGDSQQEVEVALLRFAWDDRIRMLVIRLEQSGLIRLWKGKKRGELFSFTSGLPTTEDLLQEMRKKRLATV